MATLTGTKDTVQEDQSWMDAAAGIDQETVEQEAEQFPHIQWVNGKPAQKRGGGVQYTGGWFISADQLGGREPQGWEKDELVHANGSSTEGYTRRDLTVALIHMRHCWLAKAGTETRVFAWDHYNEATEFGNVSGKSHALVCVQGLEDYGPLILTMKGSTSRAFGGSRKAEGVMGAFKRLVIGLANALNQKRGLKDKKWPYRAFWLTVGPERNEKGEPIFATVGEGANSTQVTLPTALGLHEKMTDADLRALFVGKALLDELTIQYIETRAWADAWNEIAPDAKLNNGKAEAEAEPELAETKAEPKEGELPF